MLGLFKKKCVKTTLCSSLSKYHTLVKLTGQAAISVLGHSFIALLETKRGQPATF